MEHFYQNVGEDWFTFPLLYSMQVKRVSDGAHFVEVGVWKGRSACYMAVEIINSGKRIRFDAVDIWYGDEGTSGYQDFIKYIEPVKDVINPVRMDSVSAAKMYPDRSLDFVFIDAGHDYGSVMADLVAWTPKVKVGGVIAGHDYEWHEGVMRAVDEFFDHARVPLAIAVMEKCWLHYKMEP